jgi:hypothetical protein
VNSKVICYTYKNYCYFNEGVVMMFSRFFNLICLVVGVIASTNVYAHGGAAVEFDKCVVELGKHRMHFTAYQPATGGDELCWTLPRPGKTILVFDLVNMESRNKPIELRIVELEGGSTDENNLGSNVKTLAHLPTKDYPTGTLNAEASFEVGKRYMAVLTLADTRPLVLKAQIEVVPQTAGTGTNILLLVLAAAAAGGFVFYKMKQNNSNSVKA